MPNALIVSSLLISLIRRLETQGVYGILPWLIGIIVPFILCYVFFLLRMLGACDSKVFSVVGSFVGLQNVLLVMIVSLFTGALLSVFKIVKRKNIGRRFRHLFQYVSCVWQEKKWHPYYDRETEGEDGIIPFTVAISLAVILCLY